MEKSNQEESVSSVVKIHATCGQDVFDMEGERSAVYQFFYRWTDRHVAIAVNEVTGVISKLDTKHGKK